jgi:electron transport complex protein RnfE
MSKSTLRNSLMLAPLLGATDMLVNSLGIWLMFMLVVGVYGVAMSTVRLRLVPEARLPASVLLAATLASCAELFAQAWSLPLQQHIGLYIGLLALQCVVLENNGFFLSSRRDRLRLIGLFSVLMIGLGLLREIIGNGTFGAHLNWMAGATQTDWQGVVLTADGGLRLATLTPGGLILLGLLIAAWRACSRPTPAN